MSYQTTGKNININVDDALKFVINKLQEYDSLGKKNSYSPYKHPIIYATPEGKLVQIPKQIQLQAIKLWVNHKNRQMENPKLPAEYGNQNIEMTIKPIIPQAQGPSKQLNSTKIMKQTEKQGQGHEPNGQRDWLVFIVLLAIGFYVVCVLLRVKSICPDCLMYEPMFEIPPIGIPSPKETLISINSENIFPLNQLNNVKYILKY